MGEIPKSNQTKATSAQWQQLEPWLLLFHIPGLGSVRLQKLLEAFGSPTEVFSAQTSHLKELLPARLVRAIQTASHDPFIRAALNKDHQWLTASDQHHILTVQGELYPTLLKAISDPPILLFVNGDVGVLQTPQVAMVGSRKPSLLALNMAETIAAEVAKSGFTITSGLAIGIDGAVHRGALAAGQNTVAVLACGVDVIYPQRHETLAGDITQQGAVVTEFPLGTQPRPGHFPRRNRIISGLSLGVLVVEATVASGSLVTSRCALEQGRDVYAMPGSVSNPGCRGCHALIRDGACLIENAEQLLQELRGLRNAAALEHLPGLESPMPECPDQKTVLTLMGYDTCHYDELLMMTGYEGQQLSELLLNLELGGFVKTVPGGVTRQF